MRNEKLKYTLRQEIDNVTNYQLVSSSFHYKQEVLPKIGKDMTRSSMTLNKGLFKSQSYWACPVRQYVKKITEGISG